MACSESIGAMTVTVNLWWVLFFVWIAGVAWIWAICAWEKPWQVSSWSRRKRVRQAVLIFFVVAPGWPILLPKTVIGDKLGKHHRKQLAFIERDLPRWSRTKLEGEQCVGWSAAEIADAAQWNIKRVDRLLTELVEHGRAECRLIDDVWRYHRPPADW